MLYYLVDALPALLGSMATLWAVCSPRHWFLRSSFLGALLLLFLLIPAYELLVAGCVQITVIMSGIRWWRKRRNAVAIAEPWRISLRNLLLFTVLAAVAMAVLASFPESPWIYWLRWTWPGFVAGCVTLFGVWLVIGQTRRLVRWTSAIGFALGAAAAVSLASGMSWITEAWTVWPYDLLGDLLSERVVSWMRQLFWHYLPVIAIGMGLFSAWLALFVKSGWFDPFGYEKSSHHRPQSRPLEVSVRSAWLVLTLAIAVLPVTLLVGLALPREQPEFNGLKPASFAFLNDADKMIDDAEYAALATATRSQRIADLTQEIARNSDATARMRDAFSEPLTGPRVVTDEYGGRLIVLLNARREVAEQLKSVDMKVETCLDQLNLWNMYCLDATASWAADLASDECSVLQELWKVRSELSAGKRLEVIHSVSTMEKTREDWPVLLHREFVEDINVDWLSHLHVILDNWLDIDRHAQERVEYHTNRTKIRLMLLDLALLSFQEANGRLPDSLEELVPDILKELPTDPYADGPLRYLRTEDSYTLYSVGPNKIDESGQGDDKTLDALIKSATP